MNVKNLGHHPPTIEHMFQNDGRYEISSQNESKAKVNLMNIEMRKSFPVKTSKLND